jgi:hypothetical protein
MWGTTNAIDWPTFRMFLRKVTNVISPYCNRRTTPEREVKVKFALEQAMNTHGGGGLIGGDVGVPTNRPHYPRNESRYPLHYPLHRKLGEALGRSGQVRKISPPPGFDHLGVKAASAWG